MAAGYLNDLQMYDPDTLRWTDLPTSSPPYSRFSHGFKVVNGKAYVHGGYGETGEDVPSDPDAQLF